MIEIKFVKEENKSIAYDGDNQIGECEFVEERNEWNIIHTEVSSLYQGQGIAKKLVDEVIQKAIQNGKGVIAECSYAKKILKSKEEKDS